MSSDSVTSPASWQQFVSEAEDLAMDVRARFTAQKHHVLATIRSDGSPRVSGSEVDVGAVELTLGSMWDAVKARDLRRDGRFALHANPGDGSMVGGDAKISGLAIEVTDPDEFHRYAGVETEPGSFHLFRLALTGVVHTAVSAAEDHLVIRTWRPGRPARTVQRR